MSAEFRIEFSPNGGNLTLTLRSQLPHFPAAGKPYDRGVLSLSSPDIDQLRLGTASKQLVDDITAQVSQWLLKDDLAIYLEQALDSDNEKIRIVLSVNDEQLRSSMSDIPFELCTQTGGVIPLALKDHVSVVHLLPKVGNTPQSSASGEYPLRVLILRSNPDDLGGSVPTAGSVLQEIEELLNNHPDLDNKVVQIHILSSEPVTKTEGKPTLDNLRTQLKRVPYDILVYLGHGEVLDVYSGRPPVGVLQLESDDPAIHATVPFDQLTLLLHERPVPVVLLVGCLTAAGVPASIKANVDKLIPLWMRGNQAVAQALINSESGVQTAVGMRFRLETTDAILFLRGFFESLFDKNTAGNVELAVRASRSTLRLGNPVSYGWSSPMVFSGLAQEPMFPFLASVPPLNCPSVERQQSLRDIFWKILSEADWTSRSKVQNMTAPMRLQLDVIEKDLVDTVLQKSCLLMPGFVETQYDQTVQIPINLNGKLNINELSGEIVVSDQVTLLSLEETQDLQAKGYEALVNVKKNVAKFTIRRNTGTADLPVQIFNITAKVGSSYPAVNVVNINIGQIKPRRTVCSSSNAIVVPAP